MQITRTLLVLAAGAAVLSTVALAEPAYRVPAERGHELSITIGKNADGKIFGGISIVARDGDGGYDRRDAERHRLAVEEREREAQRGNWENHRRDEHVDSGRGQQENYRRNEHADSGRGQQIWGAWNR